MSPFTRRRRFTFLPPSVRGCAATTMSAICPLTPFNAIDDASGPRCRASISVASHEQARDRRLLVDVADGLAHQLGDGQDDDLARAALLVRDGDGVGDDEA